MQRKFLCGGCVGVVLSIGNIGSATPPPITVQSPLPWLQIVSSTNSQFKPLLQQAVGTVPDALISVLPFSVVITNDGTETISGIVVRFAITTAGKTVYRDLSYYNFPRPIAVLAPKKSLLITPLKGANDIAHQRPSHYVAANEASTLAILAGADGINVSIDLVVSVDGRMAGPDQAQTISQMRDQTMAHHDMVTQCVAKLNAGVTDDELVSWLSSRIQQQTRADRYGSMQSSMATGWIAQIKNGQREQLATLLVRFTSTEDTTLKFLTTLKGGLQ